ncbi:response regulator [Dechloromonas sp. XY25]|uniref:Response regulator n=2 Tax=Dechloromonas hankyongensis TaxID=2908002 RepID=A0ABS9JX16_9RHOO|nr:response regulator [Dechloromonas hankyongensis]
MRGTLSRMLWLEGFEVILAATGSRALELLGTAFFDLVLLDVHMPDVDGFTVLSKIRERPESFTLPVIMLTGADDRDSVLRSKQLGISDYLVKPYRVTDLLSRIDRCLDNAPKLLSCA